MRSSWHPLALSAILAAWLTTVGNLPLWLAIWRLPETQGWHALITVANLLMLVLALTLLFLSLTMWPRWRKPMGLVLLLVVTSTSYFMQAYGVVIDPSMLRNALYTDTREVRDLLSGEMIVALVLGVLLPGWWWWRQTVKELPLRRLLPMQLGLGGVALLALPLLTWANFQDLASLMRNHKPLRYMVNPYNTLYAIGRTSIGEAAQVSQPLQSIGWDASLQSAPNDSSGLPPLIVLVVGETARAANFGIGGYDRDTTPRLEALQKKGQLVYYPRVSSCGTNTQDSVPCMFSHLGREEFQASNQRYENLLDVLQRVGLAVLWIDNQSGCKGVCERIPNVHTANFAMPGLCSDGECQDEAMLRELPARLAELDSQRVARGSVVVMHQMGSHGPAYYKRTTGPHKRFTPECDQAALQNCSREQIVNAYDNSIRYTDYLLTETVKWLQARGGPTALVYVSDHGESLGEKGLYLHGMPYRMAPQEQTHVPMILWVSPSMAQRQVLNVSCLRNTADRPISHDYLFHTMLSLTQVRTTLHLPSLSVLEECYAAGASDTGLTPDRGNPAGRKP